MSGSGRIRGSFAPPLGVTTVVVTAGTIIVDIGNYVEGVSSLLGYRLLPLLLLLFYDSVVNVFPDPHVLATPLEVRRERQRALEGDKGSVVYGSTRFRFQVSLVGRFKGASLFLLILLFLFTASVTACSGSRWFAAVYTHYAAGMRVGVKPSLLFPSSPSAQALQDHPRHAVTLLVLSYGRRGHRSGGRGHDFFRGWAGVPVSSRGWDATRRGIVDGRRNNGIDNDVVRNGRRWGLFCGETRDTWSRFGYKVLDFVSGRGFSLRHFLFAGRVIVSG